MHVLFTANSIFNSFDPFLLPLVLILYSKLSPCSTTRQISSIILVSYLASISIPNYFPYNDESIIASGGILLIGLCFCTLYIESVIGMVLVGWMILITLSIYCFLFFKIPIQIDIFGIDIIKNSNFIWRESLLTFIVSCGYTVNKPHKWRERDIKLALITTFLYFL